MLQKLQLAYGMQLCMCCAGVGMSHLTGEVKRLMSIITKYDQVGHNIVSPHIL